MLCCAVRSQQCSAERCAVLCLSAGAVCRWSADQCSAAYRAVQVRSNCVVQSALLCIVHCSAVQCAGSVVLCAVLCAVSSAGTVSSGWVEDPHPLPASPSPPPPHRALRGRAATSEDVTSTVDLRMQCARATMYTCSSTPAAGACMRGALAAWHATAGPAPLRPPGPPPSPSTQDWQAGSYPAASDVQNTAHLAGCERLPTDRVQPYPGLLWLPPWGDAGRLRLARGVRTAITGPTRRRTGAQWRCQRGQEQPWGSCCLPAAFQEVASWRENRVHQ